MDANKTLGIAIAIIFLLLCTVGAYFYGYSNGKNNLTVPPIVVVRDTIKVVTVPIKPSIDIETKTKTKYVIIPVGVDSAIVEDLIKTNDSLFKVLGSMQVKRVAILDTLIGELKDTVKIAHEIIQDYWKVHIGISPRKVEVPSTVTTIYIPPPKREWWDNPYVPAAGGLLVGLIIGLVVK